MRNYGDALREQRMLTGKSVRKVAAELGINNGNLSRWERGEVIPSIYFCELLADYYGITIDELIGRDVVGETVTDKTSSK